jgi:energy-converting hydrogenase Eha subunit C
MTELLQAIVNFWLIFAGFIGIFIFGACIFMLAGLIAVLVEAIFSVLLLLLGRVLGWKEGQHYRR